jgi:hypothetical protein
MNIGGCKILTWILVGDAGFGQYLSFGVSGLLDYSISS